jgi:hypothetical protein
MRGTASLRSESAGVCQQVGCLGVHERRGDTTGSATETDQDASVEYPPVQRYDGSEPGRGIGLGGGGCEGEAVPLLRREYARVYGLQAPWYHGPA